MITIFTPTYNRRHLLGRLFRSLQSQTSKEFEWIIIDDGSTDDTKSLVQPWLEGNESFAISFHQVPNGGKMRAINRAVALAQYDFMFIVDSDDWLADDAVELVNKWCDEVRDSPKICGVSGIRVNCNGTPLLGEPQFEGNYIDATNIERQQYNLQADMAEIYRVSSMREFPFQVWHDETFTPECTVWDNFALHGLKVRWHKNRIYYCDYQQDGLSGGGGYSLYAKNLMGCAMAEDIKCKITTELSKKLHHILEIGICCCLKHDISYLSQCTHPILAHALLPLSYCLSLHRRHIIKRFAP